MNKKIEIGDFLILQDIDNLIDVIVREVVSINNPDINDDNYQIRPKGLSYDYHNFYNMIKVVKKSDLNPNGPKEKLGYKRISVSLKNKSN